MEQLLSYEEQIKDIQEQIRKNQAFFAKMNLVHEKQVRLYELEEVLVRS